MSEHTTGADLEQLEDLASTYGTSGAAIAARGRDLRTRITQTVERFDTTMSTLRTQAVQVNEDLQEDVDGLTELAAATTWTGANRAAFDQDLATLRQAIARSNAAIVEGLDQFDQTGLAPFRTMLHDYGVALTDAGNGVEEATATMQTGVADQRSAIADAADVGWTAV